MSYHEQTPQGRPVESEDIAVRGTGRRRAGGSGAPSLRLVARLVAVVGVLFVLLSSSASAVLVHHRLGLFGAVNQPAFGKAEGVAVDQATGDVLVVDAGEGAGTLSRYHEDGTPANFSALGTNVIKVPGLEFAFFSLVQVAVDSSGGPSNGDIYVAIPHGPVEIFAADGKQLGELTESKEGPFAFVCGVGVDPAGAVYVADLLQQDVHKFVPTGKSPVTADNTANFPLSGPACQIATGAGPTAGFFFTAPFGAGLEKIDSATGVTQYVVAPQSNAIAAVDSSPTDGHVFVTEGPATIVEYDASQPGGASQRSSFGIISEDPNLQITGLAVNGPTGNIYVAIKGTPGVEVWSPALIVPDVKAEPATPVNAGTMVLHGTINAAGGPPATCEFQYTTEAAFNENGFAGATTVACAPAGPFTGSGTEPVSAEVGGLTAGVNYVFRLIGTNTNGSNPEAGSREGATDFHVGPKILHSALKDITATAATLQAEIEPNAGEPAGYRVEYGSTTSYGSSQPVPDANVVLPLGKGNFGENQQQVGIVSMSQGAFAVGQQIVGEGIEAGTVVTKIEHQVVGGVGLRLFLMLSKPTKFGNYETPLTSPTAVVAQRVTGLAPGSTYHFRVVATGVGASAGPDAMFSTFLQETGDTGRNYELVSPARKLGEAFAPEPAGELGGSCLADESCLPGVSALMMPMQSAPDGEAVAFEGQPFSTGLAAGPNEYVSGRSDGGWSARSITPPLAASGITDHQSGFKALAADLSRGVFFQSERGLSPDAPLGGNGLAYNDLYLWEAGVPASVPRPLVRTKPPHRIAGAPEAINSFQLSFAGGNSGTTGAPAFGHLVFEANDALTQAIPGIAPAAPEVEEGPCGARTPGGSFSEGDCNLYEWVDGQLRLINVLPGNTAAASHAVIGSGRRLAAAEAEKEIQAADVDHAISADGERIFWSDEHGQVFVRFGGRETKEVHDPGQFVTASVDGSKVLLSDGCLYSIQAESCESLGGSPSGFLGILGASDDLSRVFFVDTEALAPGAQPGSCEPAQSGIQLEEEIAGKVPAGLGCNLYAYDHGSVTFIASLFRNDNEFGFNDSYGTWKASRSDRTAQVTRDGRSLAFMSRARLTGYDSRQADAGNCEGVCFEVFDYDMGSKTLTCASCNPTGQRPLGRSNLSLIRPARGASFSQPENLPANGEGRLFFESQDVLSSKDANGHIQDVYEWEPDGVGGCERTQGCVALISSGHNPNDSMFLTATPDAKNVFFVTREQLLGQDQDDQLDVYDARIGGGINVGETAPCGGEACKGPLSSSAGSEAPGSSSFGGPGNLASVAPAPPVVKPKPLTRARKLASALKACAKKPRKQRAACRVRAMKRYGSSATSKSRSNAHKGGK